MKISFNVKNPKEDIWCQLYRARAYHGNATSLNDKSEYRLRYYGHGEETKQDFVRSKRHVDESRLITELSQFKKVGWKPMAEFLCLEKFGEPSKSNKSAAIASTNPGPSTDKKRKRASKRVKKASNKKTKAGKNKEIETSEEEDEYNSSTDGSSQDSEDTDNENDEDNKDNKDKETRERWEDLSREASDEDTMAMRAILHKEAGTKMPPSFRLLGDIRDVGVSKSKSDTSFSPDDLYDYKPWTAWLKDSERVSQQEPVVEENGGSNTTNEVIEISDDEEEPTGSVLARVARLEARFEAEIADLWQHVKQNFKKDSS